MECHHITPKEAGGDDALDNCIPVCFDCHADMKSYDFKHPKGNKYTEAELRQHRDRWYEKVAQGGGLQASPDHLAVDRQVFAQLKEQLPYFPTFDYLKGRNFAGFAFEKDPLTPMGRYAHYGDRPENEFLDVELESIRSELLAAIRIFSRGLAEHTWPLEANPKLSSVPQEWEEDRPERFRQAVDEIHRAADEVEDKYSTLIRLARRRLDVP